jgi:chemotaxis signal transduction protein
MCIGTVTYHRQRIPVLRTQQLTGLGRSSDAIESEVVLLRCGPEERIGLAVDTINRMIAPDPAEGSAVPPALCRRRDIIGGVLRGESDAEQIFVLDPERIGAEPDVAALAALSRPTKPADARRSERERLRGDVVIDRTRHLLFDAGTLVAAPAEQILRVLTLPAAVTPVDGFGAPGVEGVFLLDGAPVLYVDMPAHLGLAGRSATKSGRVLLIGQGAHRIGFAVRSVDGIETSEWRRTEATGPGGVSGAIVQLGRGPDRRIVPALDLRRLAGRLTEGLQADEGETLPDTAAG